MALNVTPKARDITLKLDNSCNCCCWRKKKPVYPSTIMYVNSRGEASVFDPAKTEREREAFRRTLDNIATRLQTIEEHHEVPGLQGHVEDQIGTPLAQTPVVTFELVERINTTVDRILKGNARET